MLDICLLLEWCDCLAEASESATHEVCIKEEWVCLLWLYYWPDVAGQ